MARRKEPRPRWGSPPPLSVSCLGQACETDGCNRAPRRAPATDRSERGLSARPPPGRPAQPGPAPSRGPPRPLLPPSVSTPSSCPDWSLCQRPRVTWARIQLLCSQGGSRGQSAGSGRGRGKWQRARGGTGLGLLLAWTGLGMCPGPSPVT